MFRDAKDQDYAYIISCWMNNTGPGKKVEKHDQMSNKDHTDYYKPHIVQLLAKKDRVFIKIASSEEEDDGMSEILGFLVYSYDIDNRLVIHFIYVGRDYQNRGLARKMVQEVYSDKENIIVTLWSNRLWRLFERTDLKLSYNPYAVLKRKKTE